MAYKPDSVGPKARRSFIWAACYQTAQAANPGHWADKPGAVAPRDPYLALLLAGLAVPFRLPGLRWALTPPFHLYPRLDRGPRGARQIEGSFFSVALSLGSLRPGVTRRRFTLESGLSSSLNPRSSSHPHRRHMLFTSGPVKHFDRAALSTASASGGLNRRGSSNRRRPNQQPENG